jgi:hypothetical protein
MKYLFSAPYDFLNSFHGGKSSKRFWGNRSLTIGTLLGIQLFYILVFAPIIYKEQVPQQTFDNAFNVAAGFICIGTTLLFGGLVERISSKKKK